MYIVCLTKLKTENQFFFMTQILNIKFLDPGCYILESTSSTTLISTSTSPTQISKETGEKKPDTDRYNNFSTGSSFFFRKHYKFLMWFIGLDVNAACHKYNRV